MKYFFTSDTHYGHEKVIDYCERPFRNLTHMDNTLIKNHNSIVSPDDTVYFLGDFCFKDYKLYKRRLNGNFIFIRGNHDRNNKVPTKILSAVVKHGGKVIYLVHDPIDIVEDVEMNLVGHVHKLWKFKKSLKGIPMINVGVDVWDYKPITIEQIMKAYNKWDKGEKK